MRGSTLRAQGTPEITQESGKTLEDIFTAISQINKRNLVIASAAKKQAQVARKLGSSLLAICGLSAQSAAGGMQSRLAVEFNDLVAPFRPQEGVDKINPLVGVRVCVPRPATPTPLIVIAEPLADQQASRFMIDIHDFTPHAHLL